MGSQNKSKVSLSQLNKLSKITAKIICKKTNFIHRYGVLHNNQHLLYWVKMRNQPQDVTWVSVWCRAFTINFGHAWLTDDIPSTAPATTGASMIILSISALLLIATLGF